MVSPSPLPPEALEPLSDVPFQCEFICKDYEQLKCGALLRNIALGANVCRITCDIRTDIFVECQGEVVELPSAHVEVKQ